MKNKHIVAALAWGVPLLLFLPPSELLMLVSAVLLHEGGHLFAFYLLREPPPSLAAALGGLTFTPSRPLPYRHEWAIALAGPFANLALALPLLTLGGAPCAALGAVHLLTALSNLLPLGRCDGARALSALLSLLLPLRAAEGVVAAVSLFSFVTLLFFLLFLLLHEGGGAVLLLLVGLLARANFPL